jgi:hypothetical protein
MSMIHVQHSHLWKSPAPQKVELNWGSYAVCKLRRRLNELIFRRGIAEGGGCIKRMWWWVFVGISK